MCSYLDLYSQGTFKKKILFSLTKRIFLSLHIYNIHIYIYTHVIIYKDLSIHYVFTTVNELKLRTSSTASVKVLDLLEQLLPPKLTRMSRGRCWLWRVLKRLILWSKHWLVGLFVGDAFWIPFWIKQDFMVHLPGGFWSLLKRSTLRFDLIFRLPHGLGSCSGIRNTYNILYGSRILNVPWALKAWQTYPQKKWTFSHPLERVQWLLRQGRPKPKITLLHFGSSHSVDFSWLFPPKVHKTSFNCLVWRNQSKHISTSSLY